MLRAKLVPLLMVILCFIPRIMAQPSAPPVFDAKGLGDEVSLDQAWLFHPGDDPGFASPTLDDTSWQPIELGKRLDTYGCPPTLQFGWLRIHVHLAQGAQRLLLGLRHTNGRYQVFVNGKSVAGVGDMNRHNPYQRDFLTTFPLPPGSDLVIALRFSLVFVPIAAFSPETPLLKDGALIGTARSLQQDATSQNTLEFAPPAIDALPALLDAIVALALFLSLRRNREYLWLALCGFFNSADSFTTLFHYTVPLSAGISTYGAVFEAAGLIALIEFVLQILGKRRSRVTFFAEVCVIVSGSILPLVAVGAITGSLKFFVVLSVIKPVIINGGLTILLVIASRRKDSDARLFLPGIILVVGTWVYYCVVLFLGIVKSTKIPFNAIPVGPFVFPVGTFADIGFELNILVFLIVRTVRIARERNRAAAEIEAAQSVQQLLLARSAEPTPGFDVQSVYLPASEVGGDFFLISPNALDGSLIVLVGDVSGKGLTAAMRVSMILGVLRRETSCDPGSILASLNQALLSQGDMGFTTACCIRLLPDGSFILSNAGHISPYIDGAEILTEPGLPLGLAGGQVYDELRGLLAPGLRMVLMSDGVVEARSKTGELYGFERLAALTLCPAGEIASTAQTFGQDDDITVLTLACTA